MHWEILIFPTSTSLSRYPLPLKNKLMLRLFHDLPPRLPIPLYLLWHLLCNTASATMLLNPTPLGYTEASLLLSPLGLALWHDCGAIVLYRAQWTGLTMPAR